MNKLDGSFYRQETNKVAQALLGKVLGRRTEKGVLKGRIVEVESYLGEKDQAAHVHSGRTKRTRVLFKKAGLVYLYLCYGLYWQFNIKTTEDKPECVLIRAIEPLQGLKLMKANRVRESTLTLDSLSKNNLTNGPGKWCQSFKINKEFYGEDLVNSDKIWIEDRPLLSKSKIQKAPRVGIDYAGDWASKKLRFYIKNNNFVSTT